MLFSLGTNVRSSLMDVEKQKILLDAFELLPNYHFLWKFEEPHIDLKLPKNVIIRPWLPQSDILAHPKVKGFFSHSGLKLDLLNKSEFPNSIRNYSNRNAEHTRSNLERCTDPGYAIRLGSICGRIFC